MSESQIIDSILRSHYRLRIGMGVVALVFPLVLVVYGLFWEVKWQTSMSAYYFGLSPQEPSDESFQWIFPVRVLFTGMLFALGVFLFLYKGFSRPEDRLLNLAGFCALGVALCPMWFEGYGDDFRYEDWFIYLGHAHTGFAVLAFVCMAMVAWFCRNNTLQYLPEDKPTLKKWFERCYMAAAMAMVFAPLLAIVITQFPWWREHFIFWIECFGVWAFGAYWLLKTWEVRFWKAEKRMLSGAKLR